MKKVIFTLAAVFTIGFTNAQDATAGSAGLAKGDIYLAASFNVNSSKQGNIKQNNYNISPGAGYLITKNIALEGSIGYNSSTLDNNGTEMKNSGYQFVAGGRYFFTPLDKFSLSVGGNISFSSNKLESGMSNVISEEVGVNVPVGLHYFVSDNFAFTTTWGGLSYATNDNGGNNAPKTSRFNLGLNLSFVSIGLIYKL